jgi:hypothetical protein
MKKIFKILLLITISLIAVSGLLLIVYRFSVISFMSKVSGIADTNAPSVDTISSSEMINLESLDSKILSSFINQTINFDFDNICRRPASLIKAPVVGASTSSATLLAPSTCSLGNGQPFK